MGVPLALFVYLGMTKEKWPFLTVETIQGLIDEPKRLDDDNEDFVECFFKYYQWWCNDNLR